MNSLRTLWLWTVTAFQAAPVLACIMCLTTIISAVLAPLTVYGMSLTVIW
jgi:hypothetical protein